MTLSELTSDIDKLERMSDSELEEHFKGVLYTTRPEMITKPEAPSKRILSSSKPKPDLSKAREIAMRMGIKLDI